MEQCGTSECDLKLGLRFSFLTHRLLGRYDEGTALMPIVEHKQNLPVSDKYKFLSLDADGFDVPSDW